MSGSYFITLFAPKFDIWSKDIFICYVDGLKYFAAANMVVFPKAKIQLCVVHIKSPKINDSPPTNNRRGHHIEDAQSPLKILRFECLFVSNTCTIAGRPDYE